MIKFGRHHPARSESLAVSPGDNDLEPQTISTSTLAEWVIDARQRTLDLIADLSDDQLLGQPLATVNPLLWEIGHLAWFSETWVLRHAAGQAALRADADALYDSSAVPHGTRWDLRLPSRADTLQYMRQVQEGILEVIQRGPGRAENYFILLSTFHEDMHGEAFFYTRQTLGFPCPVLTPRRDGQGSLSQATSGGGPLPGDVGIPGGDFMLGASRKETFVFDNEKWAHPVDVRPFAIARAPVTQSEFAEFVEADGYGLENLWTAAGWRWRNSANARQPLHWRRVGNSWLRRDFDRWVPLESNRPVVHVNWHEADAYCRWRGRRLPSEAEWEAAAAAGTHDLSAPKRRFPWGEEPVLGAGAQMDGHTLGCCDVADLPAGDSFFGCRNMIGNVWEWTASDFLPYPGFAADPYQDYSQPWFGTHKVLRGGAWPTRGRLLRNTWRNFYLPDRRDIWAGFRTCALQPCELQTSAVQTSAVQTSAVQTSAVQP